MNRSTSSDILTGILARLSPPHPNQRITPDPDYTKHQLLRDLTSLQHAAHQEAFAEANKVLTDKNTSPDPSPTPRGTFLADCLTGAIESGHAGSWMTVIEYSPTTPEATLIEDPEPTQKAINYFTNEFKKDPTRTTIPDQNPDEPSAYRITTDTITIGLNRIRTAYDAPPTPSHPTLQNPTTIPYLSRTMRDHILAADLVNDAGTLDVIDYLAILEIALFNEIRYA